MSRKSRILAWASGALISSLLYNRALAFAGYEVPDYVFRKLLLAASSAAAAMVGSTLAILIYDGLRKSGTK